MKTPLSTWYRASILFALMATVACGDDPVAPGIEPEIVNNTDAFSYQIRDLSDVGGSWDYTWQNTGTLAKITHATNAGATGTATLTLRDADGTEVYSGPLASSGEPVTSPTGTSGAWTVTVTYTGYTNDQVNFELSRQ
jgi:hypothetical protein